MIHQQSTRRNFCQPKMYKIQNSRSIRKYNLFCLPSLLFFFLFKRLTKILIEIGQEMIVHKCSYKAFVEVIKGIKLIENIQEKIRRTPFGHFVIFGNKLVVDSSLLDDCCSRWKSNETFEIGILAVEINITAEVVGKILHIPHGGWKIDLRWGDYRTTFYDTHLHQYIMNMYTLIYFCIFPYSCILLKKIAKSNYFLQNNTSREIEESSRDQKPNWRTGR